MSVTKINGWQWRCNQCPISGVERLKKDAVKAETLHAAMHRPGRALSSLVGSYVTYNQSRTA